MQNTISKGSSSGQVNKNRKRNISVVNALYADSRLRHSNISKKNLSFKFLSHNLDFCRLRGKSLCKALWEKGENVGNQHFSPFPTMLEKRFFSQHFLILPQCFLSYDNSVWTKLKFCRPFKG